MFRSAPCKIRIKISALHPLLIASSLLLSPARPALPNMMGRLLNVGKCSGYKFKTEKCNLRKRTTNFCFLTFIVRMPLINLTLTVYDINATVQAVRRTFCNWRTKKNPQHSRIGRFFFCVQNFSRIKKFYAQRAFFQVATSARLKDSVSISEGAVDVKKSRTACDGGRANLCNCEDAIASPGRS